MQVAATITPHVAPIQSLDFNELRAQLARAVRRVCPFWLHDRADDIVQTGMVKLFGIAQRKQGTTFNATYLRKVAYTAMVSEIRRQRATREVHLAEESEERIANPRATNPEHAIAARRIGMEIEKALDRVSHDRRLAVRLYLKGHGVTEIADMMDWNPKRAENLVYRGLADMRKHLAAAGVTP